ncbi:hypothetical protein [Leptospira noguchii]|nr:hypothetical protein [Leptospira noguchii]
MERKELNETLFTKAFETQHNAFLNSASRFSYVSCVKPFRNFIT